MAKSDQPASYESKKYKPTQKNDMKPVPEIQGKKKFN